MRELPRRTALKLLGAASAIGATSTNVMAAEAGVSTIETGDGTQVEEGGDTDEYGLVLHTQPSADVTVSIEPDNGQVTTDKDSVTFTPTNWDSPQSVTVSAIEDEDVEEGGNGLVAHSTKSADPNYDGIDVPPVRVVVVDNDLPAEVEGTIESIDLVDNTITAMGIEVDIADANFTAPNYPSLTKSELKGDPFPGRGDTPGFVGGTLKGEGLEAINGGEELIGKEIFVEVAENVVFGPVTENTIPEGGAIGDDGTTLKVQSLEIVPIGDSRQPFHSSFHGLDADHGTIPVGSALAAEGYYGGNSTLYVHTVEIMRAEAPGNQTSVTRARCDETGKLKMRGASSTYPETVTIYNNDTEKKLGTADVIVEGASNVGTYKFRKLVENLPSGDCPHEVRVENSNGSSATAQVDIDQ